MKLSQLAARPQLIMFTVDNEEIVKKYNEPLDFYSWDRQPLEVFMKLASAQQQNIGDMIDIIRPLILDDAGQPIIQGDVMLPSDVLIAAIAKIVERLGK
jgi:hypothetical protein